jgi:hypothetical protein
VGSRIVRLFNMILPTRGWRSVLSTLEFALVFAKTNRQDHLGPTESSWTIPFPSLWSAHIFLPEVPGASKGNA